MSHDFSGKHVVVMGLGLHGGGLAVAKWFFTQGAHVVVTDGKTREELASSVDALTQFCVQHRMGNSAKTFFSVEYVLGKHREEDFANADLIIQNPAVPNSSPYLQIARDKGIAIENEASLFFGLTQKTPIVAVTGTRGKTTTVSLAYHIAKAFDSKSILAGNLAQVALFDIIDDVLCRQEKAEFHPIILELSSWQLEHLAGQKLSPHIAVMTNMMEDHLNRYAGMPEYIAAKQNIYLHQKPEDYVVMNFDNDITRELAKKGTPGKLVWFSHERRNIGDGVFVRDSGARVKEIIYKQGDQTEVVCNVSDISLPGEHNLENSLAAIAISKLLGISNEVITSGLRSFPGVSDRLEQIAIIAGRTIYNDTTATTPDATIAALTTLSPRRAKNIILIAGGADKQLNFGALAQVINRVVHSVVLLSGTATPKLGSDLYAIKYKGAVEMANSMDEAVTKAWRHSQEGDIIVLSPGAASFGMFVHEFDRGAKFRQAIARLSENL